MRILKSTSTIAAFAAGTFLAFSGAAHAQASGCQTDFQKVMEPRQALIARISSFRNKRPTAGQACSTLGSLVAADRKLISWMTENKDWCQIPDQMIEQLQTAAAQAARSRGTACQAAKNQANQVARARQQQQGAAPAVGSGVRLPQGAL